MERNTRILRDRFEPAWDRLLGVPQGRPPGWTPGRGVVAAFSLKVVRRENFSLLRATVFSLTKPSTD